MLLIVMHESGTWRVRPGETLTFGRGKDCTIRLAAGDRGLSRAAGSFAFEDGAWWLRNDSASSLLYLSGDRGFRVDLPPGMRVPVQLWHAKVRLQGVLGTYMLRLRLPDLDAVEVNSAVRERVLVAICIVNPRMVTKSPQKSQKHSLVSRQLIDEVVGFLQRVSVEGECNGAAMTATSVRKR